MTEREQREWCALLGKTVHGQRRVILDLLQHANSDEMTARDRAICLRQLARLNAEIRDAA